MNSGTMLNVILQMPYDDLFFLITEGLAAVLVLAAVICLAVIAIKAKRRGGRIRLTVVSIVLLAAALPFCISYALKSWYGCSFFMTIPKDFVRTEDEIEDYSLDSFSLNGIRYIRVDDMYYAREASLSAVACYMPEGLFERSSYSTYYRVSNERDFDVLYGNGLFVNEAEYEAFVEYYTDPDNLYRKVNVSDRGFARLDADMDALFREFEKSFTADIATARSVSGQIVTISLRRYSDDGVLFYIPNGVLDQFALYDGAVFVVYAKTDNGDTKVLLPVPEKYGEAFKILFETGE